LSDAKLSISKFTYLLEDEPFEINGSVSNPDNYEYDFTMNGRLDLSKITQIYPLDGIQLAGLMTPG